MNTLFLVLAQFETAEIPLEKLCDQFGMNIENANRKAALHELPIPFYKKAWKSGYFCHAQDWADYLDASRIAARQEWQKMNNHTTGARA